MDKGKIFYMKRRNKVVFPVARAEGVLYNGTTVDHVLAGLRTDLDAITRIGEDAIDAIVSKNNN